MQPFGLLSGDQIRAIRERHALTQVELAGLLRLGPNTISRWEAGRNVQTAALDVLLRLIRDLLRVNEHGLKGDLKVPRALASTVASACSRK